MADFILGSTQPAIRSAPSTAAWRCPWCGESTWINSTSDVADDPGRVQMYCDNSNCDSRETELIIMRGERSYFRADVRALHAIDDGMAAGEAPMGHVNIMDPAVSDEIDRRAAERVPWRQSEEPYSLNVH